jgi:5'-nucleotidase
MEGAICGKPAIAVSVADYDKPDYRPAARFTARLVEQVLAEGLPRDILLNVNVPNLPEEEILGVEITRQGKRRYEGRVERRLDPRGRAYYWLGGEIIEDIAGTGSDGEAIMQGKISITPLHLDLTSYPFADTLRGWKLG